MGIFKKKKISSKTMTVEEYIAAVCGPIRESWVDPVLLEKTGLSIEDLFKDNVKIKKAMSGTDIQECTDRVVRMIYDSVDVVSKFHEEEKPYHEDSREKRMNAAVTGVGSISNYDSDFYHADTILRIMKEIRSKSPEIETKELSIDGKDILWTLEDKIKMLKKHENIMYHGIIVFAHVSMAEMKGYKKN